MPPRAYAGALQNALAERGCSTKDGDRKRDGVVVRTQLELSRALGLPQQIGQITGEAAQVLSWLAGYQRAG